MASICFYFQVHQPYRLRPYSVFEALSGHAPAARYFDERGNAEVVRKVAAKCYAPANAMMLDLVRRHAGRFRITYSITALALEQFALHCPEVLAGFQALAATGCVEFLAETSHHSLCSLAAADEFRAQVALHGERTAALFGTAPRSFRNTELIYDDGIARMAAGMGFAAILAEGADRILAGRSPNVPWRAAGSGITVLLRNYGLADDIAFRFSDRQWKGWPLTPAKFAASVDAQGAVPTINLFMDYETIGEHQWAETGIFDFWRAMPGALLARGHEFLTVTETAAKHRPVAELSVPATISWADSERDVSAWLGNTVQNNALTACLELEKPVKASGRADLLDDWRKLTTSDHFYYMSTKLLADGDVHAYFSPYPSPYDAYINYMNVLEHVRRRLREGT